MTLPILRIVFLSTCVLGSVNLTNGRVPASNRERLSGHEIQPGYTAYEEINAAYKIYGDKFYSWDEGKRKCSEDGARLAIVDSHKKLELIARINPKKYILWTGISKTCSKWGNVDDGTTLENLPWLPGYPGADFYCANVSGSGSGLTYDKCGTRRRIICELQLHAVSVLPEHPRIY